MESSISGNASPGKTPPKSRKKLFLVAGIIGIVAVIVILLIVNAILQNQPTADLQATSWSIDQSFSGPTTFTVQVSNNGSAYGSKILVCYVNNGVGTYSNSQTVALNAGGTMTVTLVVPTNYGTTVTRSMCTVYFE